MLKFPTVRCTSLVARAVRCTSLAPGGTVFVPHPRPLYGVRPWRPEPVRCSSLGSSRVERCASLTPLVVRCSSLTSVRRYGVRPSPRRYGVRPSPLLGGWSWRYGVRPSPGSRHGVRPSRSGTVCVPRSRTRPGSISGRSPPQNFRIRTNRKMYFYLGFSFHVRFASPFSVCCLHVAPSFRGRYTNGKGGASLG